MKKTISLITITLLFLATATYSQKQLYFGLGGSFLNTWTTNQNNYGLPYEMDYVVKFGGAGNINIGFDFNNSIGLKLEAGYGVLGQKYEDNYNDTIYTRSVNMSYIQVPLLFKYRTAGKTARFYIMAGPQFNFLMSAKQTYYKAGIVYDEYVTVGGKKEKIGEETITERYESFDVMARIDFGVDITLIPDVLFLNAGITSAYGLLDINATEWRLPDHSSGQYNPSHNLYGGMNVGINYVLPLGGK